MKDSPPPPAPVFVGRTRELAWLDERLSSRRTSASIIVAGPAGVGKTALIKQALSSLHGKPSAHSGDLTPLWVDLYSQPAADTAIAELIRRIRDDPSGRHEPNLLVILDGAEVLTNKQLEATVSRVRNYKRVRSVVMTTRHTLELARGDVLNVGGLLPEDAKRLVQTLLQSDSSDAAIEEAVQATHGYPLAALLLARMIADRGGGAPSDVLSDALYDLSAVIAGPSSEIVAVAAPRIVTAREALVEGLRQRPDSIYELPPRKFEELLAELLTDRGWEVELTPATRDGGKDILAYLQTDVGRLLCLVEAKKYRRDRKIGVDLVRTLYGTLCDHQANSAMLVTTSSFTSDAHEFQQRHPYHLSLRDYVNVVQWIQHYKSGHRAV